ncbi:MAG: phosphatidate cytidylyltransferase [Phycisphaerales bacterium]|nr:phosphatidate cytidylyltransferase [Phycisphaerales bacterium]
MKQRLIVGLPLALLFLAMFWLDDRLDGMAVPSWLEWLFPGRAHPPRGVLLFVVALVITPLAARELAAILRGGGIAARTWLTTAAALLGLILSFVIPTKAVAGQDLAISLAIVPTGLIVAFVASLFTFSQNRNVQGVAAAAGGVVFAMVYLGLMTGFLLAIRRWHSAWWIVGIIATTKMCDTGAYFTGKAIGRRKLIPWLSPGKTWEGLVGGIVVAALTGTGLAAASSYLPSPQDHLPWWMGTICGVIFALVGQFGDLAMSLFKRGAGVKDSSSILPGMGGVLDVLDSPLMVAPVAFWLLVVFW